MFDTKAVMALFDTIIIYLLRTHIFVRADIPERENVCGVQVQVQV